MSAHFDERLKQAYEAGQHMRDAHKSRESAPLYAMGEDGQRWRQRWQAGWDKRDAEIRRERA